MRLPEVSLISLAILSTFLLVGCGGQQKQLRISADYQEPQNYLSNQIAAILNENTAYNFVLTNGILTSSGLDSIKSGAIDFSVVDNYTIVSDDIRSIMPLYPQILHVLHRRDQTYSTVEDLIKGNKVYAGAPGSGTYRFLTELMRDYGIRSGEVTLLSDHELFDADVLFTFTDLLGNDELRDLSGYKLFSFDDVESLGKGSLVEGICTRYPQFSPFVIAKDVYGDYTEEAILTLEIEAVLVTHMNLDRELVYDVIKALDENKQEINTINPLFHDFSGNFDPDILNIKLHQGARDYLERYEPTFLEKYAEVFSVIISIFVALASTVYSVSRWQKSRKKDKIDVYYKKLLAIRAQIGALACSTDGDALLEEVKAIQEETVGLVVHEKLMADESFSIFLNLSKIITEEIMDSCKRYKSEESVL